MGLRRKGQRLWSPFRRSSVSQHLKRGAWGVNRRSAINPSQVIFVTASASSQR